MVDMGKPYEGNMYLDLSCIAVGDANNDGNAEVYVTVTNDAHMFQYRKVAGEWLISDLGRHVDHLGACLLAGGGAITVGDGDDDGRNEVYVNGILSNETYIMNHLYRLSFNGSGWNRTDMGATGSYVSNFAIGDGNNDDRNEIFCGDYDGHVYMYVKRNDWSTEDIGSAPTYWQDGKWCIPNITDVCVADGDHDGSNEVYASCTDNHVYMFSQVMGKWTRNDIGTPEPTPPAWSGMLRVVAGDADGDGNTELITASQLNRTFWCYKWNETTTKWDIRKIGSVSSEKRPDIVDMCWGDGDKDGKEELYATVVNGRTGEGMIFRYGYDSISGKWIGEKILTYEEELIGIGLGSVDTDVNVTQLYVACSNGHAYEIFDDRAPPSNPVVWSDTHPVTGVWSARTDIHVLWNTTGYDISGIGGYSYKWDNLVDSLPDEVAEVNGSGRDLWANLSDGKWYFHIRACDRTGNWNEGTRYGPVFIDTTPPEGFGLLINEGAEFCNSSLVSLTLTGSDATPGSGIAAMSFSNDNVYFSDWEPFSNNRTGWNLTEFAHGGRDADGEKRVYSRLMDGAGNEMRLMKTPHDSIFLDRGRPGPTTLVINGGATHTTDPLVDLTISSSDPEPASGVSAMRFSEDLVHWTPWETYAESRSYMLSGGDGNKTVHVEILDRAGNIGYPVSSSIGLDTATTVISDLRIVGITDSSATVTWRTDEDADSAIEYGRTATYGLAVDSAGFVTSHALTLRNLTADTEYHLRVRSRDRAGNPPAFSDDRTFVTLAWPDVSAPLISDIKVEGIRDVSAVVTWRTNKPADSTVDYGHDVRYGSIVSSKEYTLQHSVVLFNLTPKTTYHFRVSSTDANGNGPAKSVDHTFVTGDAADHSPPVITGVRVDGVTDRLAVISWVTDEPANGSVEYGIGPDYSRSMAKKDFSVFHQVILMGLAAATQYHYRVLCQDPYGNGPTVTGDFSFTTDNVADNSPPTIINLRLDGITSTGAVVLWETDEIADGYVMFGETDAYGLSLQTWEYSSDHSFHLRDLSPKTTYHLRVRSTDPSGNTVTGRDVSFTTLKTGAGEDFAPPVLSGVWVAGVTDRRAVVLWETDELADGQVEYGLTEEYGGLARELSYYRQHSVVLEGLMATTTYHLRVKSTDVFGNGPSVGSDMTFTTAAGPDMTCPRIFDVKVTEITETSAMITWSTDEPATTQVSYGEDTSLRLNLNSSRFVVNHAIRIDGLAPSTMYYYSVLSTDPSGNVAQMDGTAAFTTHQAIRPGGSVIITGDGNAFLRVVFLILLVIVLVVGVAYVVTNKKKK